MTFFFKECTFMFTERFTNPGSLSTPVVFLMKYTTCFIIWLDVPHLTYKNGAQGCTTS